MPDWDELTELLAQDAETKPGTSPPAVAERYERRFGRVRLVDTIREALHSDRARPGRAHRTFAQLPFDTIYTTNFDLLLEDAYLEEERPFRSLVGDLQIPFHAGNVASSIVKMHGDLRQEEHIVVTQSDYEAYMDKYPVVATYLSSMLITRTPLFLGYSLSDPDFRQIRQVVRARLGAFERTAYVVQFDASPEDIEQALKCKLHVVSLDSSSDTTRDAVLANFLSSVQSQLDTKSGITLRASRPDVFEEIEVATVQEMSESKARSTIIEAASRLCFVSMPLDGRLNEVYRTVIAPAVEDVGLSVLRAEEMSGPGFIIEQIRAAIQQSRVCIADVTGRNPSVLYELGLAQAMGKPLVLLAEQTAHLPSDVVASKHVITYGRNVDVRPLLRKALASVLSEDFLEEATRLIDLKQYRGAIAALAVVLEQSLRAYLSKSPLKDLERMSLGQMVSAASGRKMIEGHLGGQLSEVVQLRDQAVHEVGDRQDHEAEFVLSVVREFLERLNQDETDGN